MTVLEHDPIADLTDDDWARLFDTVPDVGHPLGHRPRVGGLFAGYGGLDLAVSEVFGGDLAWYAEFDGLPTTKKPQLHGASRLLAHRFPGVMNIGDVTKVDWALLRGTIEILTGGSPCQDLSHAGKRAGMTEGTRSNLWVAMREAIAVIRPHVVIWENVRGAFTASADSDLVADPRLLADVRRRDGEPVLSALGRVLGDLAELGYDASWVTLRAADVGAPHGRPRVFVVATDASRDPWWLRLGDGGAAADAGGEAGELGAGLREGLAAGVGRGRPADGDRSTDRVLPTPRASDGKHGGPNQRGSAGDLTLPSAAVRTLPTPSARDYKDHTIRREPHRPDDVDTLARALTDVPAATTLLPTPAVNDMGEGKTVERWDEWTDEMKAAHGNGNGHGKSLAIEAQRLLPTPNTQDALGAGSAASRDDGRQAQLHDTVKKLLPTPTGQDSAASGGSDEHNVTLTDAAVRTDFGARANPRLLPTPNAEVASGRGAQHPAKRAAGGHQPSIADVAEFLEADDPWFAADDDDDAPAELALLPTPLVGSSSPAAGHGQISGQYRVAMDEALARWGDYAPAIRRWELLLGRPAPDPTMTSTKGNPQLAPAFVEWMMGLPAGWVTAVPGATRNEMLRALGNGVCPQQAIAGIRAGLRLHAETVAA